MNPAEYYQTILCTMLILAPVVFLVLLFIPAPYGRFSRRGWGPSVNQRVGWLIMEVPASLVVAYIMLFKLELNIVMLAFLLIWQVHYVHRAFIYPFQIRELSELSR